MSDKTAVRRWTPVLTQGRDTPADMRWKEDGEYVTYADYAAMEARAQAAEAERDALRAVALRMCGDGINVEVRYNDDGTLDEIVGAGRFHLEQMEGRCWFLNVGGHGVFFRARSNIKAHVNIGEHPQASKWDAEYLDRALGAMHGEGE